MKSLYDDPFDHLFKYDGTCLECSKNHGRCNGKGDCKELSEFLERMEKKDFQICPGCPDKWCEGCVPIDPNDI